MKTSLSSSVIQRDREWHLLENDVLMHFCMRLKKKRLLSPLFLLPLLVIVVITGCASKGPVLYPNAHYKAVGKKAAEQDITECKRLAKDAGVSNDPSARVAKKTAEGAAIGAAAGGAWGLVRGKAGERAAAGAATGGATGMVRGTLRSGDPDPIYRNFVQRCLRERGYDVIGWR